jgi:hypothetical protein
MREKIVQKLSKSGCQNIISPNKNQQEDPTMADRIADPNLNREDAIRGAQRAIKNLEGRIRNAGNNVARIAEFERQKQVRENELQQLIVLTVEENKKRG